MAIYSELKHVTKHVTGIPKVPELGTAHFFDGHFYLLIVMISLLLIRIIDDNHNNILIYKNNDINKTRHNTTITMIIFIISDSVDNNHPPRLVSPWTRAFMGESGSSPIGAEMDVVRFQPKRAHGMGFSHASNVQVFLTSFI